LNDCSSYFLNNKKNKIKQTNIRKMNTGKITLIDGGKTFDILVDSATMTLFTFFEKYNSNYDRQKKSWSFEKIHYDEVVNDLKEAVIIDIKKAESVEVEVFLKPNNLTQKTIIVMSQFNREIVDIIKTIYGKRYFKETKEWEIDSKFVDELKEKLKNFKITDVI
jgi:hypothetical protein